MPISGMRVLREDLMFGEAPRWHEGRLYLSDFYAKEVVAIDLDGGRESIVTVPQQPSGLGWLPNGDMVIASMRDATVMRFDGSALTPVASVAETSPVLNDMSVTQDGLAYVGGMPDLYTLLGGDAVATELQLGPEPLYLVQAGERGNAGSARVVVDELEFPNGIVITPDGRTLIVAETMAMRLTAFDVEEDGSLSNRRVWAELGCLPDGICLDAEGCVWVAVPEPDEANFMGFIRVAEGGEVSERVPTDLHAVAVELGGPDGDDIFFLEAQAVAIGEMDEASVRGNSHVVTGKADVPGAAFA
jgi:sugar lactone lactonase YvrE